MKLTDEDKDNIFVSLTYFIMTRENMGVNESDELLISYRNTLEKFRND